MLDSGVVFDTNMEKKSKGPLRFKVGKGVVIRGVRVHARPYPRPAQMRQPVLTHQPTSAQWDEALLTMSKGEQARIVIESDWAYGRKGKPEAGCAHMFLHAQRPSACVGSNVADGLANVCMCVCACVYACVNVCLCVYVCVWSLDACTYLCVCISVCMCVGGCGCGGRRIPADARLTFEVELLDIN
jgi:hypothetical protein